MVVGTLTYTRVLLRFDHNDNGDDCYVIDFNKPKELFLRV